MGIPLVITKTVRGEQDRKRINYSYPALVNLSDCLDVDNYQENDKENVNFKDRNKDKNNYNNNDNYQDKENNNDNANDKDKKNDKDE